MNISIMGDISPRQQIYCSSVKPINSRDVSQFPTGWSPGSSTVRFIMHTVHHTSKLNFPPLERSRKRNNIITPERYHRQTAQIWYYHGSAHPRYSRHFHQMFFNEMRQWSVITVTYRRDICRLSLPAAQLLCMHVLGMFSQYKSQQLI